MMSAELNTLKTMIGNSFARADAARGKAEGGATADAATRKAGPKPSADGPDAGFMLTASLEDLKGNLREMSKGASEGAQKRAAAADDALARMEGISAFSKALAGDLDKVMESMSRDLERTMKMFGFNEPDDIDKAKGLKERFDRGDRDEIVGDLLRRPAGAAQGGTVAGESVAVETSRTALSVRNIELTVEVGGKSLTLSYDNASFSVEKMRAAASAASDGNTTVSSGRVDAFAAEGLSDSFSIKADGFSKDELASIAKGVGELMKKGDPAQTFEGLVTLKPLGAAKEGEAQRYAVDLAGFFDDALGVPRDTAVLTLGAGGGGGLLA